MTSRSSRSGRGAAGKGKRRSTSTNNSQSSNPISSNTRSRSKQPISGVSSKSSGRSAKPTRQNDPTRTEARSGNGTSHHKEQIAQQTIEVKPSRSTHPVDLPPVSVLYEDNHVIGVVKPVNIPSQADDTGDMDMLTLIKQDLKQRHQKEGNVFLGLVHRLDRPVGGAMLFAKTSKGASRLSDAVRNGKLVKRYVAVLRGIPKRPQATLKDTLLKNARTNTSAVVSRGTAGAKDAVLDYELLATDTQANLSLVLIKLHTGRSHQIRVQMAHAGHPLYGDQRYGVSLNRPGEQLALWSVLASAPHPVKDERINIVSLPPRTKPWAAWSESLYDKLAQQLEDELD